MFKKQNPEPAATEDLTVRPPAPRVPPLRTFVILACDEKGEWGYETIYAQYFDLGDGGMVAFIVQFLQGGTLVQTPKIVFNGHAWRTVEEINTAFPEMVTH